MKRKPATLLLFLTLLIFGGQLLAAPFFACHREHHGVGTEPRMSAEQMRMMDCSGMEMAGGEESMEMEDLGYAVHAVHAVSPDEADVSGPHACEQLCLGVCAAAVPTRITVSVMPVAAAFPAVNVSPPHARLGHPFKPPIAA